MTTSLLSQFALNATQLIKLAAELHRPIVQNEQVQARVELNVTAQAPADGAELPGNYVVAVRLTVIGLPASGNEADRIFSAECILNASYVQIAGEPLRFAAFAQAQTTLTRQLFPLVHAHLQPSLHLLGLGTIRLPQDVFEGDSRDTIGTRH
jgi:hypothetical protein